MGRIPVVSRGIAKKKRSVLARWNRNQSLLRVEPRFRGWLADVLRCVEELYSSFTLENFYAFESELASKHPNNRNIRPKIRQQLQMLRDLGTIEFVSPGVYRRL